MKLKHHKGLQLSLGTVVVFTIVIVVLAAVSAYFSRGFGGAGLGIEHIYGGAANKTEEIDFVSEIEGSAAGGKCIGTPILERCGEFYQLTGGLRKTGYGNCEVPSCSLVGGYPVHSWYVDAAECSGYEGYGGCVGSPTCDVQGYASRWCTISCSHFTKYGKELCECTGCHWSAY